MGCSALHQDSGPGMSFHLLIAPANAQYPFQNVPGLIVVVMDVDRRDQARLFEYAAWVPPFRDDELPIAGTQDITR